MRRSLAVLAALGALACAPPARAQTPPDATPLFAFPGSVVTPARARSAGLALADRWLGDAPYDNPAGVDSAGLELSGLALRVSRQDLRRHNRAYDEQSAYLDGAGGSVALVAGRFGVAIYARQPVLRLEDNAFTSGALISASPATLETSTSAREQRFGVALAWGGAALGIGVAGEWTARDDRYEVVERSGAPTRGTTVSTFSGGAPGGAAGVRARFGDGGVGTVEAGAAFHLVPELEVDGEQNAALAAGTTRRTLAATRGATWEGGVSVRVVAHETVRVLAAIGGHGDETWDGFGLTRGAGSEWSLAGEYHDERDPWIARIGLGGEEERGVPEPRAGRFAVGLGWRLESTILDAGLLHRTTVRPGEPNSSDDRVVVSVTQRF